MATKEIKIGESRIRAMMDKSTFNKDAGTVDVIFATETPVSSFQWEIGDFNEILSCDPSNVRMARSLNGLPVFDSHYPRNAMSQLGVAENVRFENGQGIATIRLGARCDEAMRSDIESGILSGISAGYNVYAYQQIGEMKPGSKEIPTYRATDWEPKEISFAPVQADVNSKIRSQETDDLHTVVINSQIKNGKMTIAEIRAKASAEQLARLDAMILITRAAGLADEKVIEFYESEKTIEVIRAENPAKTPPTPEVDVEKIRSEATLENKNRLDAILKSTRAAKLPDADAIEYFNGKESIENIRQLVIDKFVAAQPAAPRGDHANGVGKEAIEKKREQAEQAILHRIDSKAFPLEKVEGARQFRGLQVHEIARELMAERGVNVRMLSKEDMADKIFNGQRDMATGDFPLLLENVMYKSLRGDYTYAPEFWDQIARETSVNDFRAKNMYQVESVNGMSEMQEGDEIKYGKLTEAKQTIKVASFGEGLQFTRRMFINDDLSAFSKIPDKFVLDWNTKRGDIVWSLLTNGTDGVVMDDGKKLFHADHKNLNAGAGSALADAGLTAALIKFKAQTGIDGKRKIRVLPKLLIVSPDLEVTARKLLFVGINPTQTSNVNVWAGAYTLIVEPRLTGNTWYLAADPSTIEGLYYAYLNGNSGLRTNRIDNFKTDSIDFAVRGEFGAAAIDFRGWQKNVGA